MKNKLNFKLKSPISIALSCSLFFQPFLVPLAHAQTTSTTHSISYDTNGNMTKDENGNTYEYDSENKLISFVKGDGSLKTEYNYYADGSRKSKQITLKENGKPKPLNPIHFYYDHAKNKNVVNETQIFNGKTVTSSYLMANDIRYARYLNNDSTGAKYYVKNHKDTTMTVGANGANPNSHSYTPYGEERAAKATKTIVAEEIKFSIASNPFLYSSQYSDAESGLQYLRARYYKADHMRFISRDTNSKPRNKYAYANGNPIMEDDPSGMMADWIKDLFTPKSLASIGAGIAAGVILGVFTGGAGGVALIGTTLLEAAGGAAAQAGIASAWDQKSYFTQDNFKDIAINTAITAGLAGIGGLAAGKIAGSEKIGAKPLFGEGKVFEKFGKNSKAAASHIDDTSSIEYAAGARTHSSASARNRTPTTALNRASRPSAPPRQAQIPRSEAPASTSAPRNNPNNKDYSNIKNQSDSADAVDPETLACLLGGLCKVVGWVGDLMSALLQ